MATDSRSATRTKKELVDRVADLTGNKRVMVKKVIQTFLDQIIDELGKGNRLEFRDFGIPTLILFDDLDCNLRKYKALCK